MTTKDGNTYSEITYSVTPPVLPDFESGRFALWRAPILAHQSHYDYSCNATTMFYLMRNGDGACVRPLVVENSGWIWKPKLASGDYVLKLLQDQWVTRQWILQPPKTYSVWLPKSPPGSDTGKVMVEWNETVISTAIWPAFQ